MTSKIISAVVLLSALSLVSCKKELQPQESSGTKPDTTATAAIAPAAPAAVTPVQVNQPVQAVTTTTPVQATPPAKTAKGMNPPHGQPGHRCDIPVGAPLNSPKGKPATQAAPQAGSATIAPVPSGTTPVVTAPGMNPPHGQPGHLCSVAVGAPLPTEQKSE